MAPISRRHLLAIAGAGACLILTGGLSAAAGAVPARSRFPVVRTDAQWRRSLSPDAFAVLRGHGTERAGSSPLDREHRRGTFHCAGCNNPLFASRAKFDSGTGWPSFFQPAVRTEVHCARCGGHLGHVFNDGPRPTGLRYCMNGVAMRFQPT